MSTFAPFPFDFDKPEGTRVDFDTFDRFAAEVNKWSREHGAAWRGQADAKWRLTSSASFAERNRIKAYAEVTDLGEGANDILAIAYNVNERTKNASRLLQKAIGTDQHLRLLFRDELVHREIHNSEVEYAELLSIGQHFGMKTPLLDMTDSAYVALYFAAAFAMEKSQEWRRDNRLAVWRVPANLWRGEPEKPWREYVLVPDLDAEELARRQPEFRNKANKELPPRSQPVKIANVFPRTYRNERLVAQQGSFVRVMPDLPLDHVVSMMGVWDDGGLFVPMRDKLVQYTLPASLALECLTHLSKMNIRASTLFPDMVGQMSFINLNMDHYDYGGQGDRLMRGSAFDLHGDRHGDFYP